MSTKCSRCGGWPKKGKDHSSLEKCVSALGYAVADLAEDLSTLETLFCEFLEKHATQQLEEKKRQERAMKELGLYDE